MTAHNLLRRAVDTIATINDSPKDTVNISPVAALIFFLTCVVFFVVVFAIMYTYGGLIPTLCMIESPESSAYVPVSTIGGDDEPPAYNEGDDTATAAGDEVNLVRTKPITSSLRATVRHLRDRAGYWSRFRGLGLFLVMGFFHAILSALVSVGAPNPLIRALAAIVADVLLANIHMTWIHVVISEPRPQKWWRRLPSPALTAWRRIAPAVGLASLTTQIAYTLPMFVIGAGGQRYANPDYEPSRKDLYKILGQAFGAIFLNIALFVLLQIPAMVAMTRVAASMLPEEDETIVPFDRTYGGKVTPTILGGEGKVGLVEAWKSFPWASRKRLLIVSAKAVGLILAAELLFLVLVTFEAHFLFGEEAIHQLMKIIQGVST